MNTAIIDGRVSRLLVWMLLLMLTCDVRRTRGSNYNIPYTSMTTFSKVTTDSSQVFAILRGVRCAIDCNRACSKNREEHGDCEGCRFGPSSHTCHLYTGPITENNSPNATEVWKFESIENKYPPPPPPPANLQFRRLRDGLYRYGSYYTSEVALTYQQSREQCDVIGGYLLDVSTSYERQNLLQGHWANVDAAVQEVWVGAIFHNGQWVTQTNLAALSSLWIWEDGFPTGIAGEDCSVMGRNRRIANHRCDRFYHYLCENEDYPADATN